MNFTKLKLATLIASSSLLIACGSSSDSDSVSAEAKLLETNAQIAYAVYSDSVTTAKLLQTALANFKAEATKDSPDEELAATLLTEAKMAWLVAREPYGQSEVYRFRDGPIDNEETGPEGDLNAWPLGEALIDYVALNGSDFTDGQVEVNGNSAGINVDENVPAYEKGGVVLGGNEENIIQSGININVELFDGNSATNEDESDVITGYHAIEFLLWGQDLITTGGTSDTGVGTSETDRASAVKAYNFEHGGQRPLTDFTSDTNAQRRHEYLELVIAKLIADLEIVQLEWAPNSDNHRASFVDASDPTSTTNKITTIVQAMGTLSYGELAGERMQVAYAGNSQEDEHSCFSDNTHRDVWLNAEGVSNSYYGDYAGYDSTLNGEDDVTTSAISGYGFDDYLEEKGLPELNVLIKDALTDTETQYKLIDDAARNQNSPFDVLLMTSENSNPINTTIQALKGQSNGFIEMAKGLNLGTVNVEDTTEAFPEEE